MGRLDIPLWCYEWMASFNWLLTGLATPWRRGSAVTSSDLTHVPEDLTTEPPIDEAALWTNLEYSLRRVLPVAQGPA